MKTALILIALSLLAGCAATRVRVRDCQLLQGTDGQQNCELIQKL